MSLLRRLENLEKMERRGAFAVGKANNHDIGPATAAFIRQLRGEVIDESDIRVLPNMRRSREGVSNAVTRFIEELRRV